MYTLHTIGLPMPPTTLDPAIGFYLALGFALETHEAHLARLVPAFGPELELSSQYHGVVAVLEGAAAFEDLEGNLLMNSPKQLRSLAKGSCKVYGLAYPVGDLLASMVWYEAQGLEATVLDQEAGWIDFALPNCTHIVLISETEFQQTMVVIQVQSLAKERLRLGKFQLEPDWVKITRQGELVGYTDPAGNKVALFQQM